MDNGGKVDQPISQPRYLPDHSAFERAIGTARTLGRKLRQRARWTSECSTWRLAETKRRELSQQGQMHRWVNITINLRGIPWGVTSTACGHHNDRAPQLCNGDHAVAPRLRRVRLVSGLARTLVLSDAALSVFFRLGIQLTLTQEIARFCALPILFIL